MPGQQGYAIESTADEKSHIQDLYGPRSAHPVRRRRCDAETHDDSPDGTTAPIAAFHTRDRSCLAPHRSSTSFHGRPGRPPGELRNHPIGDFRDAAHPLDISLNATYTQSQVISQQCGGVLRGLGVQLARRDGIMPRCGRRVLAREERRS